MIILITNCISAAHLGHEISFHDCCDITETYGILYSKDLRHISLNHNRVCSVPYENIPRTVLSNPCIVSVSNVSLSLCDFYKIYHVVRSNSIGTKGELLTQQIFHIS